MPREKELSIMYFTEEGLHSMGMTQSKITDILKKSQVEVTNVDVKTVKDNMIKTLDGILDIFENEVSNDSDFEVDEIEVGLVIGCGGSVSILSTVSGEANTQASITVRLKRKDKKNGQ